MRLSSPDDNPVAADYASPTEGGAPMEASPVRYTSTTFPGVHRALYAVQGDRLSQSNDVDISNLLQLPQYYWNNWDQWMANAIPSAEDPNQAGAFSLDDPGLLEDTVWSILPDAAEEDTGVGMTVQQHQTSSSAEAQGQAAVTTALLRYMLEGSQARA